MYDGILTGLSNQDFRNLGYNKSSPLEFVKLLKKLNKKTDKIISVNNNALTEKQKEENYDAQNFNESSIYGGYFCSTFDPFIMLVCEIFHVSIYHKYENIAINYIVDNPKK